MLRNYFIELLRTQVYGTFPSDDAAITDDIVNGWISIGLSIAAKQNYKDNLQIEGIGFLNNSFYSTFNGLTVTPDERFLWKVTAPEIPIGLGRNEGISRLLFKDDKNNVSYPALPLSANQMTFVRGMRPVPNKLLYYSEGGFIYAISTIHLDQYTATVTMVSGGTTALTSEMNIPNDYIDVVVQYIQKQIGLQRAAPQDAANDGVDMR